MFKLNFQINLVTPILNESPQEVTPRVLATSSTLLAYIYKQDFQTSRFNMRVLCVDRGIDQALNWLPRFRAACVPGPMFANYIIMQEINSSSVSID